MATVIALLYSNYIMSEAPSTFVISECTPSDDSKGGGCHLGITKARHRHVRCLLVEVA